MTILLGEFAIIKFLVLRLLCLSGAAFASNESVPYKVVREGQRECTFYRHADGSTHSECVRIDANAPTTRTSPAWTEVHGQLCQFGDPAGPKFTAFVVLK